MTLRASGRTRQSGVGLLPVLAVLLLAAAGGALIAWWIVSRVDLTLRLRNQPVMAVIPQDLTGRARVSGKLDLRLDETIRTRIPIDQPVQIPVSDTVTVIAHFDGEIPLKMNVRLKDRIPLKQVVKLDTTVEAYLPELGSTLKIPLRGKIPIDTVVPVDMIIPVDQPVRLTFTRPVTASIRQTLTVPLKTVIEAEVPIAAGLQVPVLNDLEARVKMPSAPARAVITEADLTLPLRTLKLRVNESAARPERQP
ncbi:hypothetical protein AAG565_08495 [Fontimonas sp. SYSU GA230001]|uniref:hypothetical protein n=1 Tax=Fontimonas sp. SYSU GA230001 TaxID=3142450 RepID=UPI0032B4019B